MADVLTPCEACGGRRYRPEVLGVSLRGRSVADILDMTAAEALAFFAEPQALRTALAALDEIGLGYVRLGQPLDTLSGGEAQRLKLAAGLIKPAAGPVLYLFDEPTAGLHAVDVDRLAAVFARLIRSGHALVAVEHDPRLIARAARVIDLGPGGGDEGGALIAAGPPAAVAAHPGSATGAALRRLRAVIPSEAKGSQGP
jgi:excinuclease ABC subunit A